ncbi:MAG: hypothetical protein F6K49_13005 [Moorea sp. SIO3I6]|nr:hypothetical protein [Moorena sp. SIO3I6]
MGRWRDGEMGRWGDGEIGNIFIAFLIFIRYSQFSSPLKMQLLMGQTTTVADGETVSGRRCICCGKFFPHSPLSPHSRFPIPVPLLGGVRGGFRFPTPDSLFIVHP